MEVVMKLEDVEGIGPSMGASQRDLTANVRSN